MATLDELQAQLAKIEAAMARPARVRFADRETEQRPYVDLERERTRLINEIAAATADDAPTMLYGYAAGKGT